MSVKYLLSNSLDILYAVADKDGIITSSNDLFKEYTSHIQPKLISDIISEDSDLDGFVSAIEKAKTTPLVPVRVYFQVKQKNGSRRWNLFNVYSIINSLHFVGFPIIDVTSVTAHEHEKQKLLLEDFRFMLSHEIRQPMTSIAGLIKLLLDKSNMDEDGDNIELLKMINQVVLDLDNAIHKLVKKASRQI
jgi:signal transduction histidine kinase